MFFCDPCREARNWPQSFGGSYGACEVCSVVTRCNDVPSKYLPILVPVVTYKAKHRKEDKNG
jgi:hypothetical protein